VVHERADARRRKEGWDAGAGGAHALGERAHRHKLDVDLAVQKLALEEVVLANVRAHHLRDLLVLEEQPEPALSGAHVGADDLEVADALLLDSSEQVLRHAGEAEAADEQLGASPHVGDRRIC